MNWEMLQNLLGISFWPLLSLAFMLYFLLGLLLTRKFIKSSINLPTIKGLLAFIAMCAPLLGLLGTVEGMILTFTFMGAEQAAQAGIGGETLGMASGISRSLVSTQLGLVIGIPALVLSKLIQLNKGEALEHV